MFEFKKTERLCSKKKIEFLFSDGCSILHYPLKLTFVKTAEPEEVACKVIISVSRKRFKKAVHRNRIKRLLRESYRLNKPPFISQLKEKNLNIYLAISYVANTELSFNEIKESMSHGLNHVLNLLQ